MKQERILVYACILLLSLFFTSFRWPLTTVKLTSTFGESRGDHLHDGVDIVSYDKRVFPVSDAVLLYGWNHAIFPFENYSGSGNYMILDHGETASIYLHLQDSPRLAPNYTQEQPIGHFANTGRSYGAHTHFGLYNRKTWDSINFLTVVDPLEDTSPPVIETMGFYIDNKIIRVNDNSTVRLTKHYPLLLNVYDTINKGDHFGIYKLVVFVNNVKLRDFSLDGAKLDKNSLTVADIPFKSLYRDSFFKITDITYQEGVNTIRVTASDFSGNTTEETMHLNVTLDM